jgi:tetratricopeptide (TPR) repeat protein
MKNKGTIISTAITLTLLGVLGYFIFTDLDSPVSDSNPRKSASTSQSSLRGGISSEDTIVEIPEEIIPNLNRKFIVPEIYSEEIKNNTIKQHNEMISRLREDPGLRNEWLQLALLRKGADDYKGAEEIWLFMTNVWTLDHVAFTNLGNLYFTDLVDLKKAEEYMKMAVELRPDQLQVIQNFYEFLRFKKQAPQEAINLLLQVYSLFSDEVYYPIRIGEFYRDTEDRINAKKYFEEALLLAQKPEFSDLKKYVEEELEKL